MRLVPGYSADSALYEVRGDSIFLVVSAHMLTIDIARTPRLEITVEHDMSHGPARWVWPGWGDLEDESRGLRMGDLTLRAWAMLEWIATAAWKDALGDEWEWYSAQIVLHPPSEALWFLPYFGGD